MRLADGVQLERGSRWNAVAFAHPMPVLSSAPHGGGQTLARRIVNLCVDGPNAATLCDDPDGTFARLARAEAWAGPLVGLMTGVAAERAALARQIPCWHVLATAGTSNAHRAGAPADAAPSAGTINVIAVTPLGLTAGARAEALGLVAEAKAAVLADLGVRSACGRFVATGTGTDATAVASGPGADTPWTGYHTESGVRLVAAVREAIRASLAAGDADV
jgi:adenosylcobinamide amidohydrolase